MSTNPYDIPASKISAKRSRDVIKTFTVICDWIVNGDRETLAIVIRGCTDAQDAANNAGLWLIKDRGETAEALFVIEGEQQIAVIDRPCFCAEDFDDVITFSGRIISAKTIH